MDKGTRGMRTSRRCRETCTAAEILIAKAVTRSNQQGQFVVEGGGKNSPSRNVIGCLGRNLSGDNQMSAKATVSFFLSTVSGKSKEVAETSR